MPPARRRQPARARRSTPSWRPKLPKLEQRHLDVIGLALVAAAIFFAFVIYLRWDGGRGGEGAVNGLRWLLGAVHYVVPVGLLAAGAVLVLRPVLPTVRPFRSGAICLFLALTLGLAAGTLGVGPGGGDVAWDTGWIKPRGGMVGEGLYWGTSTLLGDLGSHTIALFLFVAAVLLLTGASIAGVLKATSDSVSTTTREVRQAVTRRRPGAELAELETSREQRVTAIARTLPEPEGSLPDVLGDAEDLDTAEFWAGDERFPELYGGESKAEPEEPGEPRLAEDPETDEPGIARSTPTDRKSVV